MTSIQTQGMLNKKTRSAGVLLASAAAAASPINTYVEIPSRALYEATPRTTVSTANILWSTSYVHVPTEADFRGIASYLMSVQEPLGIEIERLFADHIEDFLD